MTTNHLVPVIRFKGFTDTWEQRKLGEVINFLNGRAYKQKELLDTGKYRVLRVGNFNTNDRWYYSDLELDNNKYADKGDLLYLWATNFGPEIWNEERVIYHYHIWKLQFLSNEIDKLYLYTWLLTDKERIKLTTNGTTMVHVTKGGMEQRVFQYPKSIDEQTKIGSFFKQLDVTIALHQRELDLLKEQKKGFLQKMFPKKDEVVPEIRFKGFTDAWEQRKLVDVKDTEDKYSYTGGPFGSDLKSSDYTEKGVRIIQLQNIGDGYFSDDYKIYTSHEKARKLHSNLIYPGEIIIAKMAEPLARATIIPSIEDIYLMASDGIRLKVDTTKYNTYYILTLINSISFRKEALNNSTGTTRKRIGLVTLGNLPLFLPSLEEQTKIGNFFKQLDDTIALHQCELEKLQEMKKAFLQKMFV